MTDEELMKLDPQEAIKELSWESIEFLLRPRNMLELILEMCFIQQNKAIEELISRDRLSPLWTSRVKFSRDKIQFYNELKRLKKDNDDTTPFTK